MDQTQYPFSDFEQDQNDPGRLHERPRIRNNVYSILALNYENGFFFPPHYHSEAELISIPAGLGGSINVEGGLYTFQEGMLLCVGPEKIHSFDIRFAGLKRLIILQLNARVVLGIAGRFEGCSAAGLLQLIAQTRTITGAEQKRLHADLMRLSLVSSLAGVHDQTIDPAVHALRDLEILYRTLGHALMTEVLAGTDIDATPVRRVIEFLNHSYNQQVTIDIIAQEACLSRAQLCRVFKRLTGMTVWDYLGHVRINRAKDLLLHSDMNVGRIADECGFSDPSYFAKVFSKLAGMTPKQWSSRFRP